ncbi:hypothetical protein GCM10027610_064400 [Dactylosporangium cerinum]
MRRAYKFLLRPTSKQATALNAVINDHRCLYNAALEERREAWRKCRVSVRYGAQSAQLKDIRRADPDGQGRWSFSSQQATLRRLDKAMQAFFRRVKAGKAPGFPRFKGWGGSTRSSGRRTATAVGGIPRPMVGRSVSICRASGMCGCTRTGRSTVSSRRSA